MVNNSAVYGGGIAGSSTAHATLMHNNVWNNPGGNYYNISAGTNDISVDPLFVTGPLGDYYLSQTAAGQAQTSPCVDYGFTTAESLELHTFTTRTDTIYDSGIVDLGYHYPTQPWIGIQEFVVPVSSREQSLCLQVTPTFSNTHFTIMVTIKNVDHVTVSIYNGIGRRIRKLFDGVQEQKKNTYHADVHNRATFPNGVYFVVVESVSQGNLCQKVVIAR